MARRQFKVAFAATGDTAPVPDAVQPDGSVSLQEGFGFDYQRDPQTDPLAKVFPRDVHNGILNEITASIGEIQQQGYPIWVTAGAPYPINAVVRHNDVNWQSNIDTNNDEPGAGAGATSWRVSGASVERFNAAIATIASAATVNLTTSAPNTSQITITGTASISAFTVAADRAFVVKFTAACTLVNSGTLATGTGDNIQCAAGDSCIIRSTAANSVEVVTGNFLSQAAVGTRGQTWQNVTASRVADATYTNTTGRPIEVMVGFRAASSAVMAVVINGLPAIGNSSTGVSGDDYCGLTFIIPNNSTYRIESTAGTLTWLELR